MHPERRLRQPRSARRSGSWARISRWTAGIVVLFLAAVLGGVAVVAGYVRSQVLDTNTYVATVAPLATDPVSRMRSPSGWPT